ncbi:MAG: PHP domain-containing protein [Chloroherpetonaceae bacterium]|nr:PHP domain-containing protein [Chthonomonadaceae bacterium]MDW8207353.1 PHP domain-containing protein [Chloroherpetonaceae bacterium]
MQPAGGIDLHTHTTASDGDQSPAALVWWAKCVGLSAIAVTDHDTTAGLAEALAAGTRYGVEVVPGVELSAEIPSPAQCHILGLGIDPESVPLRARLQWVREARAQRNALIAQKIQAYGWDVTLAEVEEIAGGPIVARPHFAQVLLRKGYVESMQEAFDRYLGRGGLFYVDRVRLQPEEAIALIHAAGGAAVLAHPNHLKLDPEATEAKVRQLRDCGLDGIEARYSQHTRADTLRYLDLAARLGMITSGGSDFHGPTVKENVFLGQVEEGRPAPAGLLQAIRDLCVEGRRAHH